MRVATQRDVALRAGVDRATVSRALDPERQGLLKPDTIRRVQDAARELRYQPNTLARGLRRQRSNIVGLSIRQAARDQSAEFIVGAEDRLRRFGVTLVVSFDDDAHLLRASHGLLDGAILLSGGHNGDHEVRFDPAVTVGLEGAPGLDIVIDLARGISIAVEHLHRLGHRRISLLSPPDVTIAGLRYRTAFAETVQRLVPGASPSIASFLPRRPASVAEACHGLLAHDDRPTALIVTDDAVASGAYGVARTLGLEIPGDLSILGFGDTGTGEFLQPSLTTISVPAKTAGRMAAELLMARINGQPTEPITLTPHLIHRGSTAPAS